MNKLLSESIWCGLFCLAFMPGCATSMSDLKEGSKVLTANDTLIRFAYTLDNKQEQVIENYALKHCSQNSEIAVKGNTTCDKKSCEVTYFCETQK